MGFRIARVLSTPERVIESLSDAEARLYYRFYVGTRVGKGRQLWPKEK